MSAYRNLHYHRHLAALVNPKKSSPLLINFYWLLKQKVVRCEFLHEPNNSVKCHEVFFRASHYTMNRSYTGLSVEKDIKLYQCSENNTRSG